MHLNRASQFQFRRSPQRFAQNLLFDLELMFIARVLIMTSTATHEIRACWLNPMWRRFDNAIGRGSCKTGLLFGKARFHLLAIEHEWHKNSLPAALLLRGGFSGRDAPQSVAAIDQFFDSKQQEPILNEEIKARAPPRLPTPTPTES